MLFTHSETLNTPSRTTSRHRVADAAGHAVSQLRRAGGAVWRYLEDVGQARARRELRLLTARWAITDPELASQMRTASDFDARSQAPSAASVQRQAARLNAEGGTS